MNTTALQREQKDRNAFRKTLERLRIKTADCNVQMHEPDNSDIYAVVTGTHLDNAMGDDQ